MGRFTLTKKALNNAVPLIGFAGSPWTVASYMIEGESSKTFEAIKSMAFLAPDILHTLLEKITAVTVSYLNAQICAGADVIRARRHRSLPCLHFKGAAHRNRHC